MKIKEILEAYSGREAEAAGAPTAEEIAVREKIEALAVRVNKCFTELVLPAVFDVENDLNQAGYWNQLNIGQSTSPESGKPNIKEVSLSFYPEKGDTLTVEPRSDALVYRARIAATGNLRELWFCLRFPKRIPPAVETADEIVPVETVTTGRVDAFLERFIKEALDAFNSDRMLR